MSSLTLQSPGVFTAEKVTMTNEVYTELKKIPKITKPKKKTNTLSYYPYQIEKNNYLEETELAKENSRKNAKIKR